VTSEVAIGWDRPFCIIGERINPSGRAQFQAELRRGDLSSLDVDVAQQVAGGAMVLDVNVGAPSADEATLMGRAVARLQELTDLPLCLDSSAAEVLAAGLAACRGKALVNSVTAAESHLARILPLVAGHGAAVIGLPIDGGEIPADPMRRLELAARIVEVATGTYGMALDDIVIDAVALPGAERSVVDSTLETIGLVSRELGVNTTVGASNVSYGMRERSATSRAFLRAAMAAGLTSAIMDARSPELVETARAPAPEPTGP
jgi:5-methyltetrahydrofolate--homocysteine methyltransferase